MLLPGPDLHCVEPLALQYFPSKYRWRPKKVLSERGAPGTAPYVKSVPGYIALGL